MKKIKVLQVVPSLTQANGISSFCVSYLKHIDLQKFDVDFLVMDNRRPDYNAIISNLKCNIFDVGFGISKKKAMKMIKTFFEEHHYDIVHCHVPNFGAMIQYYAKRNGVKVRILHSHATRSSGRLSHRLRNSFLEPIAVKLSTHYLACSNEAGKALFGNRSFGIVNNALDIDDFQYSKESRKHVRKEYNIDEDTILLGNVGRLCNEKNQKFLINILADLDEHYRLILIGDGPTFSELKDFVRIKGLEKRVIFTGVKNDIQAFYSAMDLFVLPSVFEGLGLALIEAQIMGLKCFASQDRVPEITNFSEQVTYLKLEMGSKNWANEISKIQNFEKLDNRDKFLSSRFNIVNEVKILEDFYKNFMR